MNGARSLRELLAGICAVAPEQERAIAALTADSRAVTAGSLFLALPGLRHDGRAFIDAAIAQGAAAVVYEAQGFDRRVDAVPAFGVSRLSAQVGCIADRFYGGPSRRLIIVGVTGTNGKTTCTQLLAQVLDTAGARCAIIGTLGFGFPGGLDASLHTTPDAITVHGLLARFLEQDTRYIAMEVSSHALTQGRVNAVAFDLAVFTNLTRDHLDYHGDMRAYGEAKSLLFDVPGLRRAIINADDDFGAELIARLQGRIAVTRYSLLAPARGRAHAEVYAKSLSFGAQGLELVAQTPAGEVAVKSGLFGEFNAANLLAVLATLIALDVAPEEAARRLARAQPAAGRVERFGGSGGAPLVVVDYAHTPDALEKVLKALRRHVRGKLWCVFGCGGNRDRGKRPEMGRIAEQLADVVILTDDNPRGESPEAIIAEIASGMRGRPRVEHDRRAAIAAAIAEASTGDAVLIAGKGHEDYQEIRGERRPYSDRDTVRQLLGVAA